MNRSPLAICWLIAVLLTATLAGAVPQPPSSSSPEPLSADVADTVDVTLRTVPFYAVDQHGQPIFDLQRDEIELRLDGVATPFDTFDRWSTVADQRVSTSAAAQPAIKTLAPRRHVFLLVDLAFLSPRGLATSRQLIGEVLGGLPARDRLYLLVNDSRSGLRQALGPIDADREGQRRLRDYASGLRPNVEFLRPDIDGELHADALMASQLQTHFQALGIMGRAEYREVAEDLATSLQTFAASVSRLGEPKLLLMFSEGVLSPLYFEGSNGLSPNTSSTAPYHGPARLSTPILYRFESALGALASAGVVPLFLYPGGSDLSAGRDTLHHFGEATGGLLIDRGSNRKMAATVRATTAAYYEIGIYDRGDALPAGAAAIELVVDRPGVRTVGPSRLAPRARYDAMSELEQRSMIVNLVLRGDAAAMPLAGMETLDGKVRTTAEDSAGRQLIFRTALPASAAGRQLDLYEVTLRLGSATLEPSLVRFDKRPLIASASPLDLTIDAPADAAVMWAMVAVEPTTGHTYFRRLVLEPPTATR